MNELSLRSFDTTLAALRGGNPEGERCLCLHGWMDNAASFVPLQSELEDLDIVALDLPGHGKSSHFGAGQHYHLLDQAAYVLCAADALGWDDFTLIGHSLGGCIAPFVAIAAPERVKRLVMLEALGPLSETAQHLPDRIKRATTAMRQTNNRLRRLYTSVDDAVEARLTATRMQPASARLIVERNLNRAEGGYVWGYDPKLRVPSSSYLSEEQVLESLRAVSVATLCVLAHNGYLLKWEQAKQRLAHLAPTMSVEVPGQHHMHMDDPQRTASAVRQFITEH